MLTRMTLKAGLEKFGVQESYGIQSGFSGCGSCFRFRFSIIWKLIIFYEVIYTYLIEDILEVLRAVRESAVSK